MEEECSKEGLEEPRVWERNKSLAKRVEEVRVEGVLDKGLVRSPPVKGRKTNAKEGGGGRAKKLKHQVLEDDLGEREDDIVRKEDDLQCGGLAKEQRSQLRLVKEVNIGDQTQPLLPPPPPGSAVVGHQPDMQSSPEEGSATHRVADAEGCQEDSTSRDAMIIKLRVIFIQQINKHPLLNS